MGKKQAGSIERSEFVRHGKLRRSRTWVNAVKVLTAAAVVVVLSGIATVSYAVWGLASNVKTVDLGQDAEAIGAGSSSLDGELTILLVGSDSRSGQSYDDGEEGELNDVTLMLHVSADHQNATVVSFPRDLMIPIPSCTGPEGQPDYYPAMSEQQLNSTLSYGGLPCTVETISTLTGMDIPYASLITFDGVIGISNAVGGVDVCLTQPIVDPATELDLPAGDNTLVGWDALQFLRTRYGVGDGGDTSRISNQQVFMSALVRKLKSAETLSDPVKVFRLAKAAVENMTLSKNMASPEFIQKMAGTVKDIDLERINFVQYPSFSHPYQEGRLTPDTASAETLFAILQSGEAFSVAGTGEGVADDSAGTVEAGAETEAPVEDPAATPEATPEATADPEALPTDASGAIKLPDNITGQSAGKQTCSAGRTVL